ncbi:hypothetical protein ACFE04_012774 [Oxalis oulophora]
MRGHASERAPFLFLLSLPFISQPLAAPPQYPNTTFAAPPIPTADSLNPHSPVTITETPLADATNTFVTTISTQHQPNTNPTPAGLLPAATADGGDGDGDLGSWIW